MIFGRIVGKSKPFPLYYFSLFFVALIILVFHVNCNKDSSRLRANGLKMASFSQQKHKNNNHYFPIRYYKTVSPNKIDRGPSMHKIHKPTKPSHESKDSHAKEPHKKDVDTTLDDLLEVIGPHLFLIPFVLKALPFAIPALPLSYILSRYAPATIPELITQLMEFANQINESMMMQGTGEQEG